MNSSQNWPPDNISMTDVANADIIRGDRDPRSWGGRLLVDLGALPVRRRFVNATEPERIVGYGLSAAAARAGMVRTVSVGVDIPVYPNASLRGVVADLCATGDPTVFCGYGCRVRLVNLTPKGRGSRRLVKAVGMFGEVADDRGETLVVFRLRVPTDNSKLPRFVRDHWDALCFAEGLG